jgi:hypothetical protein
LICFANRIGPNYFDGIRIQAEDGYILVGHMASDETLRLRWGIPKADWDRAGAWTWALAVRHAMSLLWGQDICLVTREVDRGWTTVQDLRLCRDVAELGVLGPLDDRWRTRENLLALTRFFASDTPEAKVALRILAQLFEAVRQHTYAGTELLVGTILEAVLRTLSNCPFKPGEKFDVKSALQRFITDRLGSPWQPYCEKVFRAFQRLRNRNAHPDWLTSPDGALSDVERERAFHDVLFLCRFYGFITLSLAGFISLEPSFPAQVAGPEDLAKIVDPA